MGIIYSAKHATIGKKVAIKVLRTEYSDQPHVVRRFFNEARVVNEIGHPHIIDIVDFVDDGNSAPPLIYMVMELLEGENLATRLERAGTLPVKEALWIAIQVTEALVAIHRRDILHRDLKPGNIFLCHNRFGEAETFPQIKLLDFGVALIPRDSEKDPKTDPGTAVGTPRYMAPEQILDRPLDQRTDVYAMGVLLYKMFAGRTPFSSNSLGQIMVAIAKTAPLPLADVPSGGPPIPDEVEEIMMQCLAKSPDRRYQSSQDLLSVLTGWYEQNAEGGEVLERDYSLTDILVRPRRSHVMILMVICVLSLGLLAASLLWKGDPAPPDQIGAADPEVSPTPAPPASAPSLSPTPPLPLADKPPAAPDKPTEKTAPPSGDVASGGSKPKEPPTGAEGANKKPGAAEERAPQTKRGKPAKKPTRRRPRGKKTKTEDISSGTMNPYK